MMIFVLYYTRLLSILKLCARNTNNRIYTYSEGRCLKTRTKTFNTLKRKWTRENVYLYKRLTIKVIYYYYYYYYYSSCALISRILNLKNCLVIYLELCIVLDRGPNMFFHRSMTLIFQ